MRLTRLGRILVGVVIAGVAVGGWLIYRSTSSAPSKGLGRPLRVGVVTWPGYAGGIVANNGFKPNENCIYWKKYNIKVEFILMEDVDVRAKAFASGGDDGLDIVWSTVDFWAYELPGFRKNGVKAKAIMQVDWSRGGDAIVVDNSIRSVEDLKRKRIALADFTPSHWLLENALHNSSLDDSEQEWIMKNHVGKPASPDARADFVAGRVDAAVVWEPDVTEALQKRKNSSILLSSKTASNLIADLMVAREDFIKEHPDVIRAFIRGWLDGTEEANRNGDQVVKLLMENEPLYKDLGEQTTRDGLPTVKWADLTENTAMFSLDGKSEPMFDRIFKDASQAWVKRGYIAQPVTPEEAKDDRFLKEIFAEGPVAASQPPLLPPPTTETKEKGAVLTGEVNIFFTPGSTSLDPNGQQLLDQIAFRAQTYSNAYVRIEGNTDNVGSKEANKVLSEKRAQSVISFLVSKYGFNKNRFIAVGNGPDKPKASNNTEEGRAKNRRTDVAIVPR